MEAVELLKELIKRQSITPSECGIYDIIKAELADFKTIELEKNGVKNLFLYKDFGADFAKDSANQNKTAESTHPLHHPSAREVKQVADSQNLDAESHNDSHIANANSSIVSEKSGLCSCEQGNRTDSSLTKRTTNLPDLSPKANATTLRNLFIVAFLSGIWHGAGWGFVIWGILHGVAMVIHRIYSWFVESRFTNLTQSKIYKILVWLITFNFINIAWIFFRAENLSGAVNLLKGMFGIESSVIPHKWSRIFSEIHAQTNEMIIWLACAFIVCLVYRNSFEMLKKFDTKILCFKLALRILNTRFYLKGGALFVRFVLTLALFYASVWAMIANVLNSNAYTPFLYFNF